MLLYLWNICISNKNKKNVKNKVTYTLFYKEQFKYLKITDSYHYVNSRNIRKCFVYLLFMFVLWNSLYNIDSYKIVFCSWEFTEHLSDLRQVVDDCNLPPRFKTRLYGEISRMTIHNAPSFTAWIDYVYDLEVDVYGNRSTVHWNGKGSYYDHF